ncbi:winged helix DNA-binding domain-containing protein [Paenibacillus sp. NEAU-GSW1]|uniref:winged helix DNA-binding domain-containing protein n=1 Tax=Paenibacillus sp. NEAU-GSW1 TaxID=2682486 RepID=UPI0012E3184B|nr:winged helix DNA-binding domain-containing protein [Paenibacillus sp. NEAU-GSW1]MUT68321.1 winged helix DNA-binding domain-containing protein [Paenibacillus sp. NEAU-GSW1]
MNKVKKAKIQEAATEIEASKIFSNRQLNRALLARQMLLIRVKLPVLEVIEKLAGMQAQSPIAPYFGLWSRIDAFRHEELSGLLQEKQVVRMALMRSTLHLVSARDALQLRPLLQPVMDRGLKGAFGKQLNGIDQEVLVAAGREMVEKEPMTFQELGRRLCEHWSGLNPEAAAGAVRNRVPLVQIPPRGIWGESGQAIHTSVEVWLGQPLSSSPDPERLFRSYLAAFGPATVKDIQAWSGLTRISEVIKTLRPNLITFRNERGEELFDLPDAPRPNADTPSEPRFLGEFDNMLLSYADRSRIMDEVYRKRVFTSNGIIRATFLIDGFVAGTWKLTCGSKDAALHIEPFRELTKQELGALFEEGTRMLHFAVPQSAASEIIFH